MKTYRLLRNNKESGPYSADDLIQMGLKAYDLVWVDGKSASWRYPCEIGELKPYAPEVEEQPFDRFYKKPAAVFSIKEEPVHNVNVIPSVAVKQPKPRIRIKADSKRIEITPIPQLQVNFPERENVTSVKQEPVQKQPAQKETSRQQTANVSSTPDWKDMWLNWEQEKKAVTEANKIDASATMRSVNKYSSINDQFSNGKSNDDVLETKFSRSLDDIKEEYAEKVLNSSRNKKSSSNSYATAAILVAAILGIGVWLGFKWSSRGGTSTEEKIVNTQPQSNTPVQNEEANNTLALQKQQREPATVSQETNDANNNSSSQIAQVPLTKKITTQKKPAANITPAKKSVVNTANKKFEAGKTYQKPQANKTVNTDDIDSYQLPSANNNNTIDKNEVTKNTNPSLTVKQDPHVAAISKFKKSEPRISDYISVNTYSAGNSSSGVKLRVQNISDIPVDLVMMDLQYYDSNGRLEKGETVYVRNIDAGATVTVQAPESNDAAKVGYKISMVSSERNNLYLIAD